MSWTGLYICFVYLSVNTKFVYCVSINVQETDEFVILLMHSFPDQLDIGPAINPALRAPYNRPQEAKEYMIRNSLCSALVKVPTSFPFTSNVSVEIMKMNRQPANPRCKKP